MKKKIVIISATAIAAAVVIWLIFFRHTAKAADYTTAAITRGNLNVVITSSGTLEAVSTVDVGTQVTGKVMKLFADFNSEVRKGQLLAIIDTVNLVAQVRDAQANLEKLRAEYKQKLSLYDKNKQLFEKNFISEVDFNQFETDAATAHASLKSGELALERAKTNLDYAYIYAPISGRIINRSVEQGQTVAASLSTPTIFTIAEDLSSMRILASVDESDIGQIKEGQQVKFTVQTYSDKTFDGLVTQIRLKSTVASNVVNYAVVISANNADRLLLPGMTATVDFYIDHRENVLLVPNTAFRFEPTAAQLEEVQKDMAKDFATMPDSIKNKLKTAPGGAPPAGFGPPPSDADNGVSQGNKPANMLSIYYLDDNGKLKICPVVTGLTDGKNTEIVMTRELKEGMKVITGVQETVTSSSDKTTKSTNAGQQNMPPPPMM